MANIGIIYLAWDQSESNGTAKKIFHSNLPSTRTEATQFVDDHEKNANEKHEGNLFYYFLGPTNIHKHILYPIFEYSR